MSETSELKDVIKGLSKPDNYDDIEVIEKARTVIDLTYVCPGCANEYSGRQYAYQCWKRHRFKVINNGVPGDKVKFDDGEDGGQLGHNAGWWPNVTSYTIIKNTGTGYLFERPDETRGRVAYTSVMAIERA